jgi:galactokinase
VIVELRRDETGLRTFWAPGRVNLIGEHTDYSGGLVLPAAIDLGITISGIAASEIHLASDQDGQRVELAADGSSRRAPTGWARYVAAVAHELDLLGRPAIGFAGSVHSNLPSGAGLSSSAALEVAIALALCGVSEFELESVEFALACQRAELRAVGVPCGIMDQAASLFGRENCAVYLNCSTLEHELVPLPDGLALVVVDSGLSHAHEFSGYARRRRELETALVVLDGRRPADIGVEEAQRLAEQGGLDDLHWRRLRHVVTENQRVRELADALRAGRQVNRTELARIFLEGHVSQRDDYETSTPELDWLVEFAYDAGVVAARMTGGGFGGSMLALVDDSFAHSFGDEVSEGYRRRFAADATVLICVAAAGAAELTG